METQSDPGGNKIGFWRKLWKRLPYALDAKIGVGPVKFDIKKLIWERDVLPETKGPSGLESDAGEEADDKALRSIEREIKDKIRLATALMNRSAWHCNFPENYITANEFEMISTQFPRLPESEAEKITMLRSALHFGRNMKYWLEQSLDLDNLLEGVAAATEQSHRQPQYRAVTMIEFLRGRHVSQFCEQWIGSGSRGSLAVGMIESAASGTLLRFFEVDLAAKEPENGRLAVAAYHATRAQLEGLRRRGVFSEENDND